MTYKILFIDEEKSAHGKFRRNFLNKNRDRFTGSSVCPEATLVEMLDIISIDNPDAVLTDYSLNDYKNDLRTPYEIEYNGGDLAIAIHAKRHRFPVFITTSLGDDAAHAGADVKIIYEKYKSFNDNQNETIQSSDDRQHLSFSDKLFHEITAYKKYISNCSNEFDLLLQKRNSTDDGLTHDEEVRLKMLDEELENSIDKEAKLPLDLKEISNSKQLANLISLAEKILQQKQHG